MHQLVKSNVECWKLARRRIERVPVNSRAAKVGQLDIKRRQGVVKVARAPSTVMTGGGDWVR